MKFGAHLALLCVLCVAACTSDPGCQNAGCAQSPCWYCDSAQSSAGLSYSYGASEVESVIVGEWQGTLEGEGHDPVSFHIDIGPAEQPTFGVLVADPGCEVPAEYAAHCDRMDLPAVATVTAEPYAWNVEEVVVLGNTLSCPEPSEDGTLVGCPSLQLETVIDDLGWVAFLVFAEDGRLWAELTSSGTSGHLREIGMRLP